MSATFSFTNPHEPETDNIPRQLLSYDNWLVVDDEKRPVEPVGIDPTAVERLLSFEEAMSRRSGKQRLAFQFSETPFVGIDYDDVAEDKTFLAEGFEQALKAEFDTYTEWSSSHTGCHQIVRGSLSPDHGHRHNMETPAGAHIEIYDSNRYFILTGEVVDGFNTEISDDDVRSFHEAEFSTSTAGESQAVDLSETAQADVNKVRKTVEEYAKANHPLSSRASACLDVWDSSVERGQGYGSGKGSEKDAEFVTRLLFWCKGNERLVENCWLNSKRADSKTVSRDDYRETTITNAHSNYAGDYFKGRYV